MAFCPAAPSSSCPQLLPGAGWHAAVATLGEEELYFPTTKHPNEASTFLAAISVATSPSPKKRAIFEAWQHKKPQRAEVRRSIVECASAPVLSSDGENALHTRLMLKYTGNGD